MNPPEISWVGGRYRDGDSFISRDVVFVSERIHSKRGHPYLNLFLIEFATTPKLEARNGAGRNPLGWRMVL